jgi:prevent-host-death family protein
MNIPAAVFKAECLKLMDEVARTGQRIVITKHGKPIAQLTPMPTQPETLFGYMKDTLVIKGDIVGSIHEGWSALSGDEDNLYKPSTKGTRPRGGKRRK